MSTTDTYQSFQKWWSETGHHAVWQNNEEDSAWEVWQAATEAAKATGTAGEPVKSYQARADEAGLLVRTKEKLFDYALAEIADWRTRMEAVYDADAAKRLRLICKMVGIESHVPADDETLWGAAFAVLGQVRAALEAARQPAPVVARFSISEAQKNVIRRAADALEGLDYEDLAGDLRAVIPFSKG